ncbi:MAG: alpha/beta fold hydrolase [Azospirillaceae bacterium]
MLFLHGGGHGAWCWQAVIAALARYGVNGHAIDLPGAGDDPTPRAGLDLDDYVRATAAALDRLGPRSVTLVGHSIAGMVLPGAAAARPGLVADVVFLAALTLRRGERGIDQIPAARRPAYFEMAAQSRDNTLTLAFDEAWRRFFNHLPESAARAAYVRLTPQPLGPYLAPARHGADEMAVPARYLAMEDDRTFPPDAAAAFAAKAGLVQALMPGDHCVMLSDPEGLVAALLERT